jgi:hypothetical protein
MKFKDMLSPEFQRHYDKAYRDWSAGRNLREAATVVFGTTSSRKLDRLVRCREEELENLRQKGKRTAVGALGMLRHDGQDYVTRVKTAIYPKAAVVVRVDSAVASDSSIEQFWERYRGRERTLLRELEASIAKYYRNKRQLYVTTGRDDLPALRRNTDIWNTLLKPEILFERHRGNVVVQVAWNPDWQEEHGLYVHLSLDAKILHVGEYGEYR